MAESRALRASTLFVLLSSGTGYSPFPSARPVTQPLHGHRQCTRVASRGRVPSLCAIAVGRGTQVGEQEDSFDGDSTSRKHHVQQQQQQQYQDSTAAATPQGGGQGFPAEAGASGWYGIQEGQPRRTLSSSPRESRSVATASTPSALRGKLSTDEKHHKRGKGFSKGKQQGKGGIKGGAKGGGATTKGSKGNPTIGKSNLDAMIAQQRAAAKRGAAFGDFAGDATTAKGDAKAAAAAKSAAKTATAAAAAAKATTADAPRDRVEAVGGVEVGVGAAEQGSLFVGDADRVATAAAEAQGGVAAVVVLEEEEEAEEEEEEEEEEGVSLSLTQRWKRRVTFVARTVQIWAFLFHVLIKLLRQKLVQRDEARMSARRRKLGRYLCKAFLKLGPTFIKIGQLLSTRVDLLSTEYIEELRQLQDDVPGFGGKKAVEIIEKELGAPVSELFDSFNTTSLAAASLGQVHEAWLDGKRFAVKVQRPGLKNLFEVDLKSIGALAAVLDRFDPKLDGASRDWGAIFLESSRVLYEEVDYTREGKNAERFSENFKGTDWIKAPSINWSRSTSKVLCMEFLEGIKISDLDKIDAAGVDRALLARRTAECYLAQLCRHGFFHCDPHPGNLACDAVGGGRIIFYDFGMMDQLSMPLKRGLVNLIFGIYGNDVKEVVDSLEDMDVIRKGADRMTVERVTRFYLGEFQTTLTTGGKYINQLDPEEEKALNRRERAQIGQDLFSGQAAVPLQFPASFTFVFRAFTTLDGIGKSLDPSYDLTKIASPYLKELLDLKDGSAYVSVLKSWQRRLGWRPRDVASVVQSPRRVEHVNDVVTKLERGDLKLRVRVLESEAAFARIEAVQGSLTAAVMATLLLNTGVLLGGRSAVPARIGSRAMLFLAGVFGLQVPVGYLKVWQLNRQAESSKGFR